MRATMSVADWKKFLQADTGTPCGPVVVNEVAYYHGDYTKELSGARQKYSDAPLDRDSSSEVMMSAFSNTVGSRGGSWNALTCPKDQIDMARRNQGSLALGDNEESLAVSGPVPPYRQCKA